MLSNSDFAIPATSEEQGIKAEGLSFDSWLTFDED